MVRSLLAIALVQLVVSIWHEYGTYESVWSHWIDSAWEGLLRDSMK